MSAKNSYRGLLQQDMGALINTVELPDLHKHCRETVERLKTEGWQFFQLSGPYQQYEGHAGAYDQFVTQVEKLIHREVRQYITEVTKEKDAEPQQ